MLLEKVTKENDSTTYKQANGILHSKEIITMKYEALMRNHTEDLIPHLHDKNIVGCKQKTKNTYEEEIEKHQILVAKNSS